jgi:hypothetical protein
VQFATASEAIVQCGSTLLLLDVTSGAQVCVVCGAAPHMGRQHTLTHAHYPAPGSRVQRVLVAGGQGIQTFACSVAGGVIAVAEQGYQPQISVYDAGSLQLLQSLHASTALGYTAIALSADGELLAVSGAEPELLLTVWQWRQGVPLAGAELAAVASSISFHPADPSLLLATAAPHATAPAQDSSGGGSVHLWQLHKLLDRCELQRVPLSLPPACRAACHAWAPEVGEATSAGAAHCCRMPAGSCTSSSALNRVLLPGVHHTTAQGIYLGCCDGSVACISTQSGAVISTYQPASASGSEQAPARSISSLAVNKHWVVAASATQHCITFLQRNEAAPAATMQVAGAVQVSAVGES